MSQEADLDLGNGFTATYFGWFPDRDINPQYDGLEDIQRAGINIFQDGKHVATTLFDTPECQKVFPKNNRWQVVKEEPLTLSPSILNPQTGLHGWVREGKWVFA